MTDSKIEQVSDTAFWVATYRALETGRADALFRDPLAGRLAGEKGRRISQSIPGGSFVSWSVVIRTRLIDELIRERIGAGVDVVLNLGAGLDTRPYRLDLPANLRWVEVDFPHVIEFKEDRLRDETPRCRLERVKLDLSDPQARTQFFSETASSAKSVLVLTEGVVPYLTNDQVASLAEDLKAQKNFHFWILDYFKAEAIRHVLRSRLRRHMKNAPFQFRPQNWMDFFDRHGWKPREIRYMALEAERWGRPFPRTWWLGVLWLFLPSSRREELRQSSGYALLEPK